MRLIVTNPDARVVKLWLRRKVRLLSLGGALVLFAGLLPLWVAGPGVGCQLCDCE